MGTHSPRAPTNGCVDRITTYEPAAMLLSAGWCTPLTRTCVSSVRRTLRPSSSTIMRAYGSERRTYPATSNVGMVSDGTGWVTTAVPGCVTTAVAGGAVTTYPGAGGGSGTTAVVGPLVAARAPTSDITM